MTASYYAVEFVTVVDRPDRRGPDFIKVEAGHKFLTRWTYLTRKAAVAVFESIVRGEYDFGSEYVRTVTALDCDCYHSRRSPQITFAAPSSASARQERVPASTTYCGHALCLEAAARDAAEGLS